MARHLPPYSTRRKLSPRYSAPHRVVAVDERGLVYLLEDEEGVRRTVHYAHLKAFRGHFRGRTQTFEEMQHETLEPPEPTRLHPAGPSLPGWVSALHRGGLGTGREGGARVQSDRGRNERPKAGPSGINPTREAPVVGRSGPARTSSPVADDGSRVTRQQGRPACEHSSERHNTYRGNPRKPSVPYPVVITRSRATSASNVETVQHPDFEGFNIRSSSPQRGEQLRGILNRTFLETSTDGSETSDCSELRLPTARSFQTTREVSLVVPIDHSSDRMSQTTRFLELDNNYWQQCWVPNEGQVSGNMIELETVGEPSWDHMEVQFELERPTPECCPIA